MSPIPANRENGRAGGRLALLTPQLAILVLIVMAETGLTDERSEEWQVVVTDGSRAELVSGEPGSNSMRVVIDEAVQGEASHIRLKRGGISVESDADVAVRFRGRARWRRPLLVGLAQANSPWQAVGAAQEVVLGADWIDLRVPLPTSASEQQAMLHFDLGSDPASVEIADVVVEMGDKEFALPSATGLEGTRLLANADPPTDSPTKESTKSEAGPSDPGAKQQAPATTSHTAAPKWRLDEHEGAKAAASIRLKKDDDPDRVRVDVANPGTAVWHVQLSIPSPAVEDGKHYEAKVKARAETERSFSATVSKNGAPWNLLGPYQKFQATPEWQEFTLSFDGKGSESTPRLQIDLGGEPGALEVSSVQWKAGDAAATEILTFPPPPTGEIHALVVTPPNLQSSTQPSAGPANAVLAWVVVVGEGAAAKVEAGTDGADAAIVQIERPGAKPWDVQVNHSNLSFQKDDKCELSLRLRASKKRPVSIAVSHAGPTWSNLGLYRRMDLGTEWTIVKLPFAATENSSQARVHLDLGGAEGNVEISDGSLKIGDRVVPLSSAAMPSGPAKSDVAQVDPAKTGSNDAAVVNPKGAVKPDESKANAAAVGWEFNSGGAQASVTLVSRQPWQVRVDASAGPVGTPSLVRFVKAPPFALQIRAAQATKVQSLVRSGDAVVETRTVDVTTDWQRVEFQPSTAVDRFEIQIGPSGGSIEVGEVR